MRTGGTSRSLHEWICCFMYGCIFQGIAPRAEASPIVRGIVRQLVLPLLALMMRVDTVLSVSSRLPLKHSPSFLFPLRCGSILPTFFPFITWLRIRLRVTLSIFPSSTNSKAILSTSIQCTALRRKEAGDACLDRPGDTSQEDE